MSFAQTVALGAVAGFTIYLGLPLGRWQAVDDRARVALAMFSVGILAFIFVDVMQHALSIVHDALDAFRAPHSNVGIGRTIGFTALLGAGFLIGNVGIALLERRVRPKPRTAPIAGGATASLPTDEAEALVEAMLARDRALRRGLAIATAIGLHNFAEGLAIGVAARAGAISLATVLIIGFALHNATEGFGIVGPLGDVRPTWRWLGLMGLIGGAPTFVGAMVGYNVTSEALQLLFYALAGGAILYVISEVWQGMRRYGHRELGLFLLVFGFMTGVITDLVITYGGG